MAGVTREQIWAALFAKLSTLLAPSGPFVTVERRVRSWEKVPASAQPYLAQTQLSEVSRRVPLLPRELTLHGRLFIYAKPPDKDSSGGAALNALIDAVELTALAPDSPRGEINTLGGLVYGCWVEGEILTYEGSLDGQAVAVVPIVIIVP